MSFKRRILVVSMALMGLVILVQGAFIGLPFIVGPLVREKLALPAGSDVDFSVESIGPSRARIADVRIGDDIRIPAIDLDYTLNRAFSLNRVTVRGFVVRAAIDKEGNLSVNGESVFAAKENSNESFSAEDIAGVLPFIPERFVLEDGSLHLDLGPRTLVFPFHARAIFTPGTKKVDAQAVLLFSGRPVQIIADAIVPKGPVSFHIRGKDLRPLNILETHFPLAVDINTLDGEVNLSRKSVSVTGQFVLSGPEGISIPANFDARAGWGGSPAFSLNLYTGRLDRLSYGMSGEKILTAADFRSNLALSGTHQAQTLQIDIGAERAEFRAPDLMVTCDHPGMKISAKGLLFSLKQPLDWTLSTDGIRMNMDGIPVIARSIMGAGAIHPDLSSPGKIGKAQGRVTLSGLSADQGGMKLGVSRAGCRGSLDFFRNGTVNFDLSPWGEKGAISVNKGEISASEIAFNTRITHPFVQDNTGTFTVDKISYAGKLNAHLTSNFVQTGEKEAGVSGTLTVPGVIKGGMNLKIRAGITPHVWAKALVSGDHIGIDERGINRILPKGNAFPGTVTLDAGASVEASFSQGRLNSNALLDIHTGQVDLPEKKFSARGIRGRLRMKDLITFVSDPGQTFYVDSIQAGQFQFDNAALRLTVESPSSVNVENLTFDWCNGEVSTESLRFPPETGHARIILFCDRLEMASLLNQVGAFDAHGKGTISGRIPISYQAGNFSFEEGYLYSKPGQGGQVSVKDLDRLTAGFPMGTPEFSYIDMASEALKDFEYNWATFKMDTHEDTLTVKMELDGKPARILPFEYKKEINAFVRVDATSPGAKFQGIKLDLNLKLPFNRVVKFGNRIKNLIK